MKNIHVIQTDKPSRLVLDTVNNNLFLTTTKNFPTDIMKFQNIYITNDEEIKDRDWCINLAHRIIVKPTDLEWANSNKENLKKIILTTDQDLIKDGVQAIDDEFLKWFIKNPSCEVVEVKIEILYEHKDTYRPYPSECKNLTKTKVNYYLSIIPKEEPKREFVGNASKWNMEDFEEPKQDKDMATLETQYKNFLKDNPNSKIHFEAWKKINARLVKQALINIMKDDEELGLYDEPKPFKDMLSTTEDEWNEFKHSPFPSKKEPFKHKVEAIPTEEILANRSNAYEFIDFDKNAKTYLVKHYIAPFLLKNGFKGSGGDSYYNSKCTVNVLEDCHQIDFNHPEYGKVSAYTDSHSIMHLVGVLTWNDLIDKNYKK